MATGDIFREDEVGGNGQRAVVEVATTSGKPAYAVAALAAGSGGGAGDASAANQTSQITQETLINTRLGDIAAPAAGSVNARLGLLATEATLAAASAKLPASLGTKTAAGSLSVTPSSDGVFTAQLSSATQAPFGIVAKADPFGALQVSGTQTALFSDTFDAALDTTNRWAVSGTTLPTAVSGALVASLTAANSASSVAVSQPSFSPSVAPNLLVGQMNIGSQQTNPNAHRFFGVGVVSSYAAATPLTDGHGFEVDVTGALNAVVYISGVRYVVNSTNPALITASGSWAPNMTLATYGSNLVWPTNGIAILVVRYYNGYAYFYVSNTATGLDVPVGVASWTPATGTLPLRFAAITTPAVSTVLATTFTLTAFLLGVSGGSNYTNSDANYPWRQQVVDSSGRAAVITPELTATGSITTQNLVPGGVATAASAVSLTTNGMPSVMIQTTGTYTGALSLQMTVDNVNWVTVGGVPLINTNTGGYLATITSALQSVFQADVAGAIAVRVTGLAAMTGTATVTLRAVPGASMVALDAALPTGANTIGAVNIAAAQTLATVTTVGTVTTLTGTTSLTPGVAATNLGKAEDAVAASGDTGIFTLNVRRDTLVTSASANGDYNETAVDQYGSMQTRNYEKQARTYSASANITAAATPSDIAILPGSATTTVFVTKVTISGIQTTGGLAEVLLIKRSAANTGGTSGAMTAIPHDSADAAATAAPLAYTANPTPGAAVGTFRRGYQPIGATTSIVNPLVVYDFGDKGRPIILRGIAQGLAVNLNGVTVTGGTFDVCFEWFEI